MKDLRELRPDDLEPLFRALMEWSDAHHAYTLSKAFRGPLDFEKYKRLAEAEAWLHAFVQGVRGEGRV